MNGAAGKPSGAHVQMVSDNDLFKPAAPGAAKPKTSLRMGMGQPRKVRWGWRVSQQSCHCHEVELKTYSCGQALALRCARGQCAFDLCFTGLRHNP